MKRILSTSVLTLMMCVSMMTFNIQLAGSSVPPATEWAGTYGEASDERGQDIVATSDGGYVIVGWTESVGAGGKRGGLRGISPASRS